MARIGVIVGSLRAGSFNQRLGDLFAAALVARGHELWRADADALDLPIYHGDTETQAFPAKALALKQALAACDALALVSPEYNGSISPLLKNAIDWASRPTGEEPLLALTAFRGKPVALLSASSSPFGCIRALGHLRQIVQATQAVALPEEVRIPAAATAFAADGRLLNPIQAAQLDLVADRLGWMAERLAA